MHTCHPSAPVDVDAHPIDATGVIDEAKLETLLVEVRRLARQFSRRLVLRSDAEDLAQDIVLTCLTSIREGTWNGRVAPLSVIVANMVRCRTVDRLRRRACAAERDDEYMREVLETSHSWMSPDAALEERELEEIRLRALETLGPACLQAYSLVREEGLSYAEVARMLGVSRRGVCAFVVKAQKQLRRQLRRRGIGVESREARPR
jgi:RNA polymerase sigma-70 factor (ECF subfamily)